MNWNHELINSGLWLLSAFAITLIGFSILSFLLVRFTGWGQQFWFVTKDYFHPKRSWKPLLGVALLLLFALLSVRMNVLFSYWYKGFYDSLQALEQPAFWFFIRLFALLATLHVVRSLTYSYLQSSFSIHWQTWLNERLVNDWLGSRAYHLGRFAQPHVDNPEQRIQQDSADMISQTIGLALGLVSAVVSMYEFTGILWAQSAAMTIAGVTIPRAMVFLVYAYVLIATVFAFWIGRPLIQLNFLNEKFNATYRYLMMRIREYSESIALYQGETVEKKGLMRGFASVIQNRWAMLWRNLKLDGYNLTVSQIAVIFPFIIQAPRLFSKEIKLGDVMQTAQAFGQVQDALSFFRETYSSFASYRAILDRLEGFKKNIQSTAQLPQPTIQEDADKLAITGLTVSRPDGQVLIRDLTLSLNPGQSLLIRGTSGTGKTTLLRSLAGLWPFAQGTIEHPGSAQTLFLSQKPYLPIGTLKAALAYPAETVDLERAIVILERIQLSHLVSKLDVEQDWSQVLSPGEQQRLAFGRILINKPAVVFLDEATSAMDAGMEYSLYTMLRQRLPQAIIVSVGHRESLVALHAWCLDLNPDGSWNTVKT